MSSSSVFGATLLVHGSEPLLAERAVAAQLRKARAEQPELICATGGATVVWVNTAAQKSAPLPDRLRRQLVE